MKQEAGLQICPARSDIGGSLYHEDHFNFREGREEEAIKTKPAREGRSVESRLTFERTSLLASKLSPIWERIRFSAGGGYARDRPRTEKVKMRS